MTSDYQPDLCEGECLCRWGDDPITLRCPCGGPCQRSPEWLDRPNKPIWQTTTSGQFIVLGHDDGGVTVLEPYDDGSGAASIMLGTAKDVEDLADALHEFSRRELLRRG